MPAKNKRGTQAIAQQTANIAIGCKYNCVYCYAKTIAKRFRKETDQTWSKMRVRSDIVGKSWVKGKSIMFPSTHDIVPEIVDDAVTTLKAMLSAGRHVVVVTKPAIACMRVLCRELDTLKENLVICCTITSNDNALLKQWEPGAPLFEERFKSLCHAHKAGFKTAVSIEPALDMSQVPGIIEDVRPYVTERIWVGTMNPQSGIPRDMWKTVQAGQDKSILNVLYKYYKKDALVRFTYAFHKWRKE